MGIDAPAFGRSVERPQDSAAARGELFSVDTRLFVSSTSSSFSTFHTNTSDFEQFVQVVSVAQRPSSAVSVQSDVGLQFTVRDSAGNVAFQVRGTGGGLLESVPSLTVEPGGQVETLVNNGSSSTITVEADITLRQG
jgi:hypothetical protein